MQHAEDLTTPEIPPKEKLLQIIEDMDDFQARLVLSFISTLFQG
jgi:hypothetical protein